MIDDGKLKKIGTASHVFYSLNTDEYSVENQSIAYEKEVFLHTHFLIVDALGNKLQGLKLCNIGVATSSYRCKKQLTNLLTPEKNIWPFTTTNI